MPEFRASTWLEKEIKIIDYYHGEISKEVWSFIELCYCIDYGGFLLLERTYSFTATQEELSESLHQALCGSYFSHH